MISLSAKVTNIGLPPKPMFLSSGVSSLRKHLLYFDPSGALESIGLAVAAKLSLVGIKAEANIPASATPAAPALSSFTNPLRVVPFSVFEIIVVDNHPQLLESF